MQKITTISVIKDNGGVTLAPIPITVGSDITIVYDGLLTKSGAERVFMHCGLDSNWRDITDVQLFRTSRGWENTMKVGEGHKLNLCFKDSADNWDNNSGHNWTYEINSY